MSKEKIPEHAQKWARTQDFVRSAVCDGAHKIVPAMLTSQISGLDGWVWKKIAVGTYVWTNASLDKIGAVYGVTREAVRRAFKSGIEMLHKQSTLETQQDFPLESCAF